jgi:hypothetical protein
MNFVNLIITTAKYYVGQTELKGNSGFASKSFQKLMEAAGWYLGAPWCAFFGKAVWKIAYKDYPKLLAVVNKCCSGSAKQTFENFKKDGTFEVGDEPRPGALVIWLHGKGPSGHEGVVVSVEPEENNTMSVVEGNTNASGSREGDRVATKLRTPKRPFQAAGLNVLGYVYPIEVA